jgi:hypothetical protein
MLTPTPMQTDSARPIRELEPIIIPPPAKAKRGLPTWVTIVAFVAAAVFLVAAVGLYMSRADAIDSRDAALAQSAQLQNQVTTLQTQVTGLQTQLADLKVTNGQLNKQVDSCQTAFKTFILMATGQIPSNPANEGLFLDSMNGCYGTTTPPWAK